MIPIIILIGVVGTCITIFIALGWHKIPCQRCGSKKTTIKKGDFGTKYLVCSECGEVNLVHANLHK
jgi:hypothetical protein